jgi:hypothetical protein
MKTWRMIVLISALMIAVPFQSALAQSAPNLGGAGSFGVLAGTTVTCTGGFIEGDVGVGLGGSVDGGCTMWAVHLGDEVAVQAYDDFLVAHASLAPQPGEIHAIQNGTLSGLTLPHGVYWLDDSTKTGLLTLDGQGDPNAVWIFKSGTSGTGSLTTASFNVVMASGEPCGNGAQVFWWSAEAATLTDSSFIGTILTGTSISVTNGNFVGQALATDAVALTTPGSFTFCNNAVPCTPPAAFTLLIPADGAVHSSATNLLLNWTESAGADTYNLYLGTTNPPPLFQSNMVANQFTVLVLTLNTTYYWYATAANGCAPVAVTAEWSFTTGLPCVPPDAPQLIGPANGASGVIEPAMLSLDATPNADYYEVFLGFQWDNLTLNGMTSDPFMAINQLYPGTPYCWMISAINDCGFARSPVWCFDTAGAPPTGYALFIIAARRSGAANSNWATDTMIYNANDHSVPYHFLFTPEGQDGTSSPQDFTGTIDPGRSVVNIDVLDSLYGLSNSSGNLRLESDEPLFLSSRTYNLIETGTYGQFIAGLPASDGVGGGTIPPGEKGQLLGVQQSAAFRTNLGVMEVMGKETVFTIRFYNAAGTMISSAAGVVSPYSWWQKNLSELGVPSGDNLRAEFEVTSGGAVLAYASVVDALTNDAYFVPAQKVSDMALQTHQLVAAIAEAKGGQGTDWRSDVYLYNPTPASQAVTLQFYSNAVPVSNFLEVPAGTTVAVTDIVSQLFSQSTGNVAGSLHLTTAAGLLAISNTFNLTENGTYGQFIPTKAGADLLAVNQIGHILQLSRNTEYRCNIGFSEYAGVATQVRLTVFDIDGRPLGSGDFWVDPHANLQLDNAFQILNITGDVDAAQAEVKVLSGGSIYAYASVVDNRTGDAIFVPALK